MKLSEVFNRAPATLPYVFSVHKVVLPRSSEISVLRTKFGNLVVRLTYLKSSHCSDSAVLVLLAGLTSLTARLANPLADLGSMSDEENARIPQDCNAKQTIPPSTNCLHARQKIEQ